MLIRQFRKIDSYSWIKLSLTAIAVVIAIGFARNQPPLEVVLFLVLFLVLGSLTKIMFRERWAYKSTNFRYFVFAVFTLLWSATHEGYELLIWSFLLEIQWQFSENFRIKKNAVWLLNHASISALVLIFSSGNGYFFGICSLLILLRIVTWRPLHVLQWLIGFLFPLLIAYLLSTNGLMNITFEWVTDYPTNIHIWLPLGLLFILTLHQVVYSYRKANQTNKRRSLLSLFLFLLGALGAWFGVGTMATAIAMLGLSFQVSNALYYSKPRWYIEGIALIIVIYSCLLLFGVTLPI
jgi:hypothetical protein